MSERKSQEDMYRISRIRHEQFQTIINKAKQDNPIIKEEIDKLSSIMWQDLIFYYKEMYMGYHDKAIYNLLLKHGVDIHFRETNMSSLEQT